MASIQERQGKNGPVQQVKWRDPAKGGKYAYRSFTGKTEARTFRAWAELEEQKLRDDPRPVGHGGRADTGRKTSVVDAMDQWLDICEKEGLNGREPITNYSLEHYTYRAGFVKTYAWPKDLSGLTAPDVTDFRSYLLRSNISRDLARKVLLTFQSMMKEMTLRGRLPVNVAVGISIRSDSRYDEPVVIPSKEEIKALLRAADALAQSPNGTIRNAWLRYRPMLYLAVDSGMRPQEYLAVAKSALTDNGIQVERAIEGDGSRISVTKTPTGRRFIDLSARTVTVLREHAASLKGKNPHNLLFPGKDGRWQDRRNWQHRGFDVACEAAGLGHTEIRNGREVFVPKFRPYDLRHFFASLHIEKRTNLKKLQKLMGHKDIETTLNVYGHLLDDGLSRAEGLLDDLI